MDMIDKLRNLRLKLLTGSVASTKWGPEMYVSEPFEAQMARGEFESSALSEFISLISKGEFERFGDVGAHVGIYGLVFKHNVAGYVDAFEPLPWSTGSLHRNYCINGYDDYTIRRAAVLDSVGEVEMKFNPEHSVEASTIEETYSGGATYSLSVEATTLDEYYDERPTPDVLKIDVEGGERAVLDGAVELLSTTPDLFVEIHQSLIDDPQETLAAMDSHLSDAGYDQIRHVERGGSVERLADLSGETDELTHVHVVNNN